MKLPKHTSPTEDIALAPYNFVPLPEQVVTVETDELPDQDAYHADRFTGTIDCLLTTESPVYVRSSFTPQEFSAGQDREAQKALPWRQQVKNKPDFFSIDTDGTPRIPGSSLRGMLRNLIEIVSYGKLEWVTDDQLVYRAVGDTTSHGEAYRDRIMHYDGEGYNRSGKRCRQYTPMIQAGYMEQDENGDWFIRPAQELGGTSFARILIDKLPGGLQPIAGCKNASRIYVQPGPYTYQDVRGGFIRVKSSKVFRAAKDPGKDLVEAALARSGPMFSKRTEAVVFPPSPNHNELIPVADDLVRLYRDQISPEQEELLGEDGVLRAGQPVFYLTENGQLIFFGHTMMMRLPYLKSPLDFVPPQLRNPIQTGLAEAIFGYTKEGGEGKARSYAGRVFVEDAILEADQDDIWLVSNETVVPRILGTPKPTTFQHYLVQQTSDPQEVGTTRDGKIKTQKFLSDYTADTPRQTVLRGHKLYWHKGSMTAEELQEALDNLRDASGREKEHDTQHTQMKPVAAGVRFRSCLRFENLSAEELGALLWVLVLPGEAGRQYRHSIGMGKPYGMGAIRLEPQVHLSDRRLRYGSLLDDEGQWESGEKAADAGFVQGCVAKFDGMIRNQIGAGKLPSLIHTERIQMLLRLLEWPGPDPKYTRYLEIERPDSRSKRGKFNEYKSRPVLPDPLDVDGRPRPAGHAASVTAGAGTPFSKGAARSDSPAKLAKPGPSEHSTTQVEVSHPASSAEIQPGMLLEGRVVRIEPSRVVVDLLGEEATLQIERIKPPIRDKYDLAKRFPVGQVIRVIVIKRNKAGRVQLTT